MRALVLSGGAAHGAFQAGVIQALYEMGWVPDLICGSSVGAINSVALATGKSPGHLCDLWREVQNENVYRFRPLRSWLKCWKWSHLLDTEPLRDFLSKHIDFEELLESKQVVTTYSADVLSGRLRAYSNRLDSLPSKYHRRYRPDLLDLDAVLASTAIPLVFPWVRGEWDGALLQYAPLKPAVLLGATEIVVVPIHNPDPDAGLPEGILQTVMRVLDFSLTPLKTDIRRILERNEDPDYRTVDVNVISPTRPFGYSKLDFSSPQKESAICHGRNRAYQVMSDDHV